MRKVPRRSDEETLDAVKLCLPDIEELLRILSTNPKTVVVEFVHGDTIFDSIDEVRDHLGGVIRELTISATAHGASAEYGTCRIDFQRNSVALAWMGSMELQFFKIADFLRTKVRLMSSWRHFSGPGVVEVFAIAISYTTTNLLILHRAHEHRTFWQRNQGEILKGVASGLIGALVGYIIRMIQTKP